MRRFLFAVLAILVLAPATGLRAQDSLTFLTVERPPFAMEERGHATGFSVELMRLIAEEIGANVRFEFVERFPEMLDGVQAGEADGAVANISITSERETVIDFSLSIYDAGLQVMVSGAATSPSIWDVIFRWEVLALILLGFGVLFLLGLLMWFFERRHEGYFQSDGRKALFPSFWWALNLVLNGGFEVNVPKSILGRLLGVFMVVSSLFVVSIFVANVTAALTVNAIGSSINSLEDLRGREVGTTQGSTASVFLDDERIAHRIYTTFDDLVDAFEREELDAVVFDGPILAYYLATQGDGTAHLLDRTFRSEDYGIALRQGSELREPINRALLRLTENGSYRALRETWFGVQ